MPDPICQNCGKPSSSGSGSLCENCSSIEAATIAPGSSFAVNSLKKDENEAQVKDRFGDYELMAEIARGGMGVVYKARHVKLNRIAALKMILSGRYSSDEELKRFYVEAEAAARLDHPAIVPVFDIGDQDGRPFFAMKYVEGGPLSDHMEYFRSDHKTGVKMISAVARGVHHAHQRGILHRDLKPANILIDDEMQPWVTDLGLAKSTTGESNLTNTGAILGTPSYMPPEQASGQQSITTAADIYSLGAILYEILTDRPPHKGESAVDTVLKVISDDLVPPSKINKQVDTDLELICLKCLEKQPDQRYDSAAALANDLDCWANGEPISIRAPSFNQLVKRWIERNSRLVYCLFAMLLGLAFTFPIITAFLSDGTDLGEVYSHFEDAEQPLFFQMSKLPEWVSVISMATLFLVIWPSIGLLNALVTRPDRFWKAIGTGVLTSFVCALITSMFLGWLVVVVNTGSYSSNRIKTLGDAIWTPEGITKEEALSKANQIYEGLENVPAENRATILSERVLAEQIGQGPTGLFMMGVVSCILAIPIVYGTVIAYFLMKRRNRFWLLAIRYAISWLSVSVAVLFSLQLTFQGRINNRPAREMAVPLGIVIAIATVAAWLAMRRWKKLPKEDTKHIAQGVN